MRKNTLRIGSFTVLIFLILSMLIGCAADAVNTQTNAAAPVTSGSDAAAAAENITTVPATASADTLPQTDISGTVPANEPVTADTVTEPVTESTSAVTDPTTMTEPEKDPEEEPEKEPEEEPEKEPEEEPVQNDKVIYLTFDDGPGPYTEQLLEILDKYNVKATFFVVNKPNYNYLIAKEYEAGHSVAVHAYLHNYSKVYASDDAYFEDFRAMNEVVKEQTGSYTNLLRFPGGSSNTVSKKYSKGIMSRLTKEVEKQGLHYFDWNVSAGDAGKTTDTDEVYNNVIKGIGNKSWAIVLQHDTKGFSVAAVERIIQWGLEHGYTFLPLDENSPGAHHGIAN